MENRDNREMGERDADAAPQNEKLTFSSNRQGEEKTIENEKER